MRNVLFILCFTALSCTKKDSFFVPIHANSYAWAMNSSKTYIYANAAGDSISTASFSETLLKESELFLGGFPNGTTGEKYTQIVEVDTLFDYTTVLLTEFRENERRDFVVIRALNFEFPGVAEPTYKVLGSYSDTLTINGESYPNVYSQTTSIQNTSLFVNVEDGLVGFTLERDTFNLVN